MSIIYDDVESDNLGECQECGEESILDSTVKICFDCFCLLDIKEHENRLNEEE